MSVSLLEKNYNTNYCIFSYDNWEKDKDSMPTMNTRGKGILSTILSCSQGSKAIGTDGTAKILNGERNEWISYSSSNSGDNSGGITGGGSGTIDESKIATNDDVSNVLDKIFGSK